MGDRAAALIVGWQTMVPLALGLANIGDFGKLTANWNLGAPVDAGGAADRPGAGALVGVAAVPPGAGLEAFRADERGGFTG